MGAPDDRLRHRLDHRAATVARFGVVPDHAEAPLSSRARGGEPILAGGSPSSVKVFTALLTRGAMTRAAIGDVTGFSPAAVTKAVRPLLAAGLLRELPEQWTPNGAGRPAVPIQVEADRAFVVGIKITADELIGVVTDLRAEVADSRHVPLPALVRPGHHAHTVDPDDAIRVIGELVEDVSQERLAGVGIAVSGDVDAGAGVVRFSPLLGWRGTSLAARVSALTGLPVSIANDVRALTVAEQWFGVGVGCPSFAVITVGTGVGCGLVVGGEIVDGAHGVAGELGHLPADPEGPPCHCGATGCVEAVIGEPALLDRISEETAAPVPALADALALGGSPRVRAIFADAGAVLGRAVASVANLLGPQRIVISGELLAAYDMIGATMHEAFDVQCFGAARDCELVVRPLQFEHWARGAASVAISRLLARG